MHVPGLAQSPPLQGLINGEPGCGVIPVYRDLSPVDGS